MDTLRFPRRPIPFSEIHTQVSKKANSTFRNPNHSMYVCVYKYIDICKVHIYIYIYIYVLALSTSNGDDLPEKGPRLSFLSQMNFGVDFGPGFRVGFRPWIIIIIILILIIINYNYNYN